MCVCIAGHHPVECVQIMTWWSSILGQWPLRNLGSVANFYVIFTWPGPTSLPDSWCPSRVVRPLPPQPPFHQRVYAQYHPPIWASPVSVTCIRHIIPMHPAPPLFFAVRDSPLWPSRAPETPAIFLSFPHPCRYQNCFYREPQLLFCCLLPPPRHLESLPYLVPRLSCTNFKNRPGGHPLRHCCLLPVACPHISWEYVSPLPVEMPLPSPASRTHPYSALHVYVGPATGNSHPPPLTAVSLSL